MSNAEFARKCRDAASILNMLAEQSQVYADGYGGNLKFSKMHVAETVAPIAELIAAMSSSAVCGCK